jgi:hypothetical protein
MKTDAPVPMTKCAFDDAGTRRTCERARQRALIDLLVRVAGWTALLIVSRTVETDAQLVEGAASLLLIPTAFLLAAPAKKLRWLRTVETVLRSFPWQHCVLVREQDAQVRGGAAVRVGLYSDGGDERWSAALAARTWRLRRPRPRQFEAAAWFAGDLDRGGVVARSGGQVLVTVQRS